MTQQAFNAQLARAMSEKELQDNIVQMALTFGCMVNHQRAALTQKGRWITATQGHRGFLDLVILGKRGALFAECKTERKRPTPEQWAWIEAWIRAGYTAVWWRPRDWFSGRIEREIRAIA